MMQKPVRATLTRTDTGETISFLYNPYVLEDAKGNEYEEPEVEGALAPPLVFKHGGTRRVRFACRFISQGNPDVVAQQVEFIRRLANPVQPANVPPLAFVTIGGFDMPIRIMEWRVVYNEWTPALKPKDLYVEVEAAVDYKTPAPPPQPQPGKKNNAKAKQNSKSDLAAQIRALS